VRKLAMLKRWPELADGAQFSPQRVGLVLVVMLNMNMNMNIGNYK